MIEDPRWGAETSKRRDFRDALVLTTGEYSAPHQQLIPTQTNRRHAAMLKKMTTRKKSKLSSGPKPYRVRRHARAKAKGCLAPMNYLMEEHPELNGIGSWA